MRPPPRLVDGGDVRARLLRAARDDAPDGRSRRRATAAIALAVGSLASRSTAALAAAAVTRSVLFKTVLGAGMVTLVAAGARDAPMTVPTPVEHAMVAPPRDHLVRVSPPPPTSTPIPTAIPTATATPIPVPTPPLRPADTLADEVALLVEAKRALDAGHTSAAFVAIAAHDRRFPGGLLAQEAAALRIEATARSGDHATAASLSRAFEATYPGSPLRSTVRAAGGEP